MRSGTDLGDRFVDALDEDVHRIARERRRRRLGRVEHRAGAGAQLERSEIAFVGPAVVDDEREERAPDRGDDADVRAVDGPGLLVGRRRQVDGDAVVVDLDRDIPGDHHRFVSVVLVHDGRGVPAGRQRREPLARARLTGLEDDVDGGVEQFEPVALDEFEKRRQAGAAGTDLGADVAGRRVR